MNTCIHCDQEASSPFFIEDALQKIGPFCCNGCLTVYNVIHGKGLSEYYTIKKNTSLFKKRAPVEIKANRHSYLDDQDFHLDYTYRGFAGLPTMEFYLEGIHCLACLWIIEKLPLFVKGVHSAKLDMGRSVATITLTDQGKFSDVAKELDSIGYRPHALKVNQESNDLKVLENRATLMRIGISGAAAGNIMLYAISLYAGAGEEYATIFNALTVLFALPVLTYCAYPFYRTSYLALKNFTLSIDVPISLALIMGGIMGIYNLFSGINENYFDSLTALVFLLLLSRYFLKIIQEKGLSTSDMHFFYQGDNILRKEENAETFSEIHPKSIKVNDILKILPNQIIPADGYVTSGDSYLNNSLLTGESQLQKVSVGANVFSGTMNVSNNILIKVSQIQKDTRLGGILKSVEDGWGQKSKIVDITNLISKYFVAVVFILSGVLFLLEMRNGNTKHALEQALTLLIVTCPCALAIATPLTFIRTLSKSTQKGIVIKDDAVIEKLSKAKNVFIDKTGTLTMNRLQVTQLEVKMNAQLPVEDIIYNLEKNSQHPVGKSLRGFIEEKTFNIHEVLDLKETPGVGVSGLINGHLYEIKNYSIYEDNHLIATFMVKDSLRPDASESLQQLRKQKITFKVLSGDKKEYVEEMAREIHLDSSEYSYELSPEAKGLVIKGSSQTIMIGDGANDSIALSYADTGIAVYGAMDISLRAADVYLSFPGLKPFIDLLVISKETMRVIYRNLVLSLLYNSVSVYLAFTGHISPLTAAIIMPLSSLTVLVSTLIGTKKLRAEWKS